YYRIKATSAVNGAVKFTETKTVKIAANATSTLAVYPNPVKDAANFTFTSDRNEQVIVRVRNAGGQIILSRNIIAAKGANVFTLSEVAQLNAGIYIVELINAASIIASERFIKN
ncbi:MAG TPA: T9SS type A sorting domain-containing protein, partial [Flavisolibacter sp.]